MGEELVKSLRTHGFLYDSKLAVRAADAIESLQTNLMLCRNELCLRCGLYAERHKGACDDCRWRDM